MDHQEALRRARELPASMGQGPLQQLLLRGWMTHDGMWFKNALQMLGIDVTNALNRAAIRDMAPLEVRRVLAAMGLDGVRSFEELEVFTTGAMALLGGDFMQFSWQWRRPDRLEVQVARCFAYEGIKRLGALQRYECGIFDRIFRWFDVLGVAYQSSPDVARCTLHHQGTCARVIRFSFAAPQKP